MLRNKEVDLVTINRKLDRDYSDGLEVLKQLKANPDVNDVPVMLVTNFDEHQEAAIREGAVRGFGKLSLEDPTTKELLKPYLGA